MLTPSLLPRCSGVGTLHPLSHTSTPGQAEGQGRTHVFTAGGETELGSSGAWSATASSTGTSILDFITTATTKRRHSLSAHLYSMVWCIWAVRAHSLLQHCGKEKHFLSPANYFGQLRNKALLFWVCWGNCICGAIPLPTVEFPVTPVLSFFFSQCCRFIV